jgi:hypothetical protein
VPNSGEVLLFGTSENHLLAEPSALDHTPLLRVGGIAFEISYRAGK